jgi:uroporphyrinogen-III decarboxylase
MLSKDNYREIVLPVNRKIAEGFQSVSYHSCGASTHLLPSFAELPLLTSIELGPGTDFAQAVTLMPETAMSPLIDPVIIRNGSPEDVESLVKSVTTETFNAPSVTLCAWSLDKETPVANLQKLYLTLDECV